ncbi:MAG: HEPN domain-containing protein [Terriglobia bacterium]
MNRQDLRRLAEERLGDSHALLGIGRFGAAYYLARYAVECALKACIARLTREGDFPDKKFANTVFTHDLEKLTEAARLSEEIKRVAKEDDEFGRFWVLVNQWSEESRYETHSQQQAEELLAAVQTQRMGCFNV